MPSEPTPSRNPEPAPPASGGTDYSAGDTPEGYEYVPVSERGPIGAVTGAFDTVRFYLNAFALLILGTVLLILGFVALNANTVAGAAFGGKAGAIRTVTKAVVGKE